MSIYKGTEFIAGTPDLSEYAKSSDLSSLDSAVVKLSGNQTIAGTKTFSSAIKCAGSATTGTAITTSAISKSANGYVKLGNGIIIQWGEISISTHNQTGTVTLPTAFTSTNYSISSTGRRSAGNGQGELSITETKSTTAFTYRSDAATSYYNEKQSWIAIGY